MADNEKVEGADEVEPIQSGGGTAAGPDTNGVVDAQGVEIRGSMGPGFEDFVSARSTLLLQRITRLLGGRILGAREARGRESETAGSGTWEHGATPARFGERQIELIGAPGGEGLIAGLESGTSFYVTDFAMPEGQTWEERVQGHMDLHLFYQGYLTKPGEAGQDKRVFSARGPHVIGRIRSLCQDEDNLVIYRQPAVAGLFDLAMMAMHNGEFFRQRGHGVDVYLTDVRSAEEAGIWRDAFSFLGEELGIPPHLFSAHVEVDANSDADGVVDVLSGLGGYALGIRVISDGDASALIKKVRGEGGQVVGPVVANADEGASLGGDFDAFLTSDSSGFTVS